MKKALLIMGLISSLVFAEGNRLEVRAAIDLGQEFNHNYRNLKKRRSFRMNRLLNTEENLQVILN